MRPLPRALSALCCLAALTFLWSCTVPWANPEAGNKQQTEAQFERDSVACQVLAGELYPLDKVKRENAFNECMVDKGWIKREGFDSPYNRQW